MTINVLDEVTPLFTFNSTYCLGDVADALPLIADNTVNGTWVPSMIQTSMATIVPDDYIFTPAASECASNATVSVQVNSPQATNFNSLPTTFCQNEAVGMLPNTSDEGFTGSWNPSAIITSTPTNSPLTFTPTSGQCAAPFNTNIQIQPLQPTVFSGLASQVCQDASTVVTFTTADDNGVTGTWFPAAISAQNVGNFNAVFTPGAGQCNEVFNWTVQVLDLPQVTFTSSPSAISCNDPDLDIIAAGGVAYAWANGLGNSAVLTVNGGSDYDVAVTDANGCVSIGSFVVPYDTVTTCYIDAITTTLNCGVLDIDLNVVGGMSYTWANGWGNNPSINVTNPDLYQVNVVHANGCDRNLSINIDQDLNPPLVAINNLTAEDTLTCGTTQIDLQGTGAVSYLWDNGMGNNAIAGIVAPGTYTVTGTGANFCTASDSYTIEQNIMLPVPTLLASDDTLDCFVDSIQLDAGGGVLYQWDHGPVEDLIYVHEPGLYEVTVFGNNGCSDEINWNIGWNRFLPDSSFIFSPNQVMDEDPTIALESPNMNGVTYVWSVDGNEFYTGPDCSYTFASFQPGSYEVCMRAYVSDICQSDTCHLVNVKESLQVFIPTSFTPGEDGINDGFYPVLSNHDLIKSYELNIFNRWGDVIFTTQNPDEAWDGGYRVDGQYFIQDGIYPYILTYQTRYDVELRKVKGTITISR
jgi:gliding motility-associated-like protein